MTNTRIEERNKNHRTQVFTACPCCGQASDADIVQKYKDTLTTIDREARESVANDAVKMADELELECGKDGDKGTKQWMAFKGFRNAIRGKYLQTNTPSH
jgi:hypothetical protein